MSISQRWPVTGFSNCTNRRDLVPYVQKRKSFSVWIPARDTSGKAQKLHQTSLDSEIKETSMWIESTNRYMFSKYN